ncbi:MAG: tetratricopeptide repeat protein [Elusimicrobia bacterium]|nr:tetratricopeptide repeat protein [Elusimicrobiota bacterium]MDE2236741.1 tetratricopeptide repeat protein [Elusimicrobiota bacterium]MDE2424636.1 tetratricopeptide repeat protein [Elusimicrobiota bacterium]
MDQPQETLPRPPQEEQDDPVDALVQRGRKQRRLFDVPGYEEAIPLLREAIELAPTQAPAYAELSLAYSSWGLRRESACLGFRHETQLPEYQSLYDLAFDYADMALRLAPDLAASHLAMAAALRSGAKADPARRAREAALALALEPEDPEVVCECWRVKGYDPEDQAVLQTMEKAPWLIQMRLDLAAALCERGRYADALAQLKQALQASPENTHIYYEIAMLLQRKGMRRDAIELLGKAKAMRPNDPLVRQGLVLLGESL